MIDREKKNFARREYRKAGFDFVFTVRISLETDDGTILISPFIENDMAAALIVDMDKFEGFIKNNKISASAATWYYSPLDIDALFEVYNNMKSFDEMETTETRTKLDEGL